MAARFQPVPSPAAHWQSGLSTPSRKRTEAKSRMSDGVEVRLHLTFLILPLFVFWTESTIRSANGPLDLALVGIVLPCVARAVRSIACGRIVRTRFDS